MKFWFDTEFFEDGRVIELISIGVVAEDGREYYSETVDAAVRASRSDWLKQNVLPHLRGPRKTRREVCADLLEFFGADPEIWAYYADYDWVVLCQLFGRMIDLPKGWPMYCRDLKQLAGSVKLPEQKSIEHDALADARWVRDAWLFVNGNKNNG